jgi:hypothetical protein
MDNNLLERLLHQDENECLDFKEGQYPFANADDETKSELLKDILAFTNAWRQTDAFILRGVKEVKGARSIPLGVLVHLNDNELQQFVNSKTNRPILFSYEAVSHEGKQLGVIRIPVQERPVFAKRNFGAVVRNVVYVRRSSSIDVADPDEVYRMGQVAAAQKTDAEPVLELTFGESVRRTILERTVKIDCIALRPLDGSRIPDAGSGGPSPWASLANVGVNRDYWREMANYVFYKRLLCELELAITNKGSRLAENVRVEIDQPKEEGVFICDEADVPTRPSYNALHRLGDVASLGIGRGLHVQRHDDGWHISASFGNIQAKATKWCDGPLYLGAFSEEPLELRARVFADNLSQPLQQTLVVHPSVDFREMTMNDLEEEDAREET